MLMKVLIPPDLEALPLPLLPSRTPLSLFIHHHSLRILLALPLPLLLRSPRVLLLPLLPHRVALLTSPSSFRKSSRSLGRFLLCRRSWRSSLLFFSQHRYAPLLFPLFIFRFDFLFSFTGVSIPPDTFKQRPSSTFSSSFSLPSIFSHPSPKEAPLLVLPSLSSSFFLSKSLSLPSFVFQEEPWFNSSLQERQRRLE